MGAVQLLTILEVMGRLGVKSKDTVYALIASGDLRVVDIAATGQRPRSRVPRGRPPEVHRRADAKGTTMSTGEHRAIVAAAAAQAVAIERLATRDPREAAVAAYVPGGPSVEELEVRIRKWKAQRR